MPLSAEHALDGVNEEEAICGGLITKVNPQNVNKKTPKCVSFHCLQESPKMGGARGAAVALTLTALAPEFPRDLVALLVSDTLLTRKSKQKSPKMAGEGGISNSRRVLQRSRKVPHTNPT